MATTNDDSKPPSSSSWGLASDNSAVIEWFAGVGTISLAFAHRGSRVAALCEQAPHKVRLNAVVHPDAVPVLDARLPCPIPKESFVHVAAGLPCQPVAPSGARRAALDYRAPLVTDAVPDVILSLQEAGKLVFLEIEEHADFVTIGRELLLQLRTNLLALPSPIVLSDPDYFSPRDYGGPIHRRRCAIRGEPQSVVARIGKPPRLRPMVAPRTRIADVALPDTDVRPEQWVEGAITLVPHVLSSTHPTVAARIECGGPSSPVDVGSRVLIDGDDTEVETSGLCDAGALVGHENLVPGAAVAVPFRLNGVEVHYAGHILRPAPSSSTGDAQYDVSFPDGDIYRARHDRLFAVVELGALPAGT